MSESDERLPRKSLVVGFVVGVSPDKWAKVWAERMPWSPLELRPIAADAAVAGLTAGLDMVLARDAPQGTDELHVIDLWTETPVVIAPKDHPIKVFDAVTVTDLADENLLEGTDDATLDLVAAGIGLAQMPQSVFRATGRRDVVGRPISDAEPSQISLVWARDNGDGEVDERLAEFIQEFIGIVRGRTVQSSRGAGEPAPAAAPTKAKKGPAQSNSRKPGNRTARPVRGKRTGRR